MNRVYIVEVRRLAHTSWTSIGTFSLLGCAKSKGESAIGFCWDEFRIRSTTTLRSGSTTLQTIETIDSTKARKIIWSKEGF